MYKCQFDVNLAIGSEDSKLKEAFSWLYASGDLKIRPRSVKCIIPFGCSSFVKIHATGHRVSTLTKSYATDVEGIHTKNSMSVHSFERGT